MDFEELFISEGKPYKGNSKRDKFLSRVFGIFNEEIIRIWCENEKSPFINIGRPTIYDSDGRHYTLDFLLKDRDEKLFITEMKCEIEYQKYKYLTLIEVKQLKHHRKKRAFELLLEIAQDPKRHKVKCNNQEKLVFGSALVWGRTSFEGEDEVKNVYKLSHIISTEQVVADLVQWQDSEFINFISQYHDWSIQLFNGLLGNSHA